MSLEEKINFVEGSDNHVSSPPAQDPFHALTGQAPSNISVPEPKLQVPEEVLPTTQVPNTPHQNYVPGLEDYVDAMNIDDLFPDKYIPGIDPDLQSYIDEAAGFINHMSHDLNNRSDYNNAGPAITGYDPMSQMSGRPDYNTTHGRNQGTLKAFQQATMNSPEVNNPGYQDPFGFSVRGQNLDRYTAHPKYDKLGFNVFADNESYYNKSSSWGNDMQRTMGQWYQIFGPAFTGGWRSLGDVFIGDYSLTDRKSAETMENSMRQAASTRGGIGGFFNDFVLNSSYTIGMLSSIVAEEIAMAAMVAGGTFLAGGSAAAAVPSVGATAPGVAAGTGMIATGLAGMLRGLKRIPQAFSMSKRLKGVRQMITSLNDIGTARKWYDAAKAGKKGIHGLANFLAPETLYALKNLQTARSAGQNILNLAHGAKTFGQFYKDIRMYNLALSESKLEGALVQNQVFEQLYSEFVEREGRAPTEQELALVKFNASRAGQRTLQANFPVIFLSNKIVFEPWFHGPKGLSRMIEEYTAGVGKRVYDTGKRAGQKGFKKGDRFKKLTEKGGMFDFAAKWKRAKERGWRGNARYLSAGAIVGAPPAIAEGMQEVYQESIAKATEHYFGDIYAEDIRTGMDLMQLNLGKGNFSREFWESTEKGFASQMFTKEGANVFMSGFLMGGTMGPSGRFFFETIPSLYQAKKDPKKYQEYLDSKTKLTDRYVQLLNNAYENPLEYLDPIKLNSTKQKQLNARKKQASLEGDMLDFWDAQQDALFSQINMLYNTGRLGMMQDSIDDYLAMDDATLAEAFSESEYVKEGRVEKLRGKLKEAKAKAKEIATNKARINKMFPSKARPEAFKEGTEEWKQQTILKMMEDHAKDLIVYNKSEMLNAATRMEEIMEWAVQQGPLANMDSATLQVLQGKVKMSEEMKRLEDFISLSALTPEQKKAKANAKKKLKALKDLNDVLFAPENQVAKVGEMSDYVTPQGKKIYKLDENNNRIPVVVDGVVQKDKKGNIIYEKYQVPKNPVENAIGGYNKSPQYIKKLRKPFINYLKTVAEIEGKTLEIDKVDSMLKKIVDYGYLNNRIGDYQAALDILMDQDFFYDTAGRLAYNVNRMWKKFKNSHHKRIKAYLERHGERVAFLKALATYKGPGGPIFPDPEEVANFLEKDEITVADIPSTFYQEDGIVTPGKSDPDTVAEINRLIQVQAKLIQGEHVQDESTEDIQEDVENVLNIDEDLVETEEEKEEARENKKTLEEFYEEDSELGANTRAILEREHKKYKALSAFEPHSFSFEVWKAHPKHGRKIVQARMMAHEMWLELSEDAKKEYAGFDDWLLKNIRSNSRLDTEIFSPLNINGYRILNKVVVDQNIMPGVIDTMKDEIIFKDTNKGLFLIKSRSDTVDPTTGKPEYFYRIIDSEGTNASDKFRGLQLVDPSLQLLDGWTKKADALNVMKNLLLSIPETKTYKFEGLELSQGETIIDSNGNKYLVASNSTQASTKGFVWLKPIGIEAKDVTTWKKILNKQDFDSRGFKKFKEDYSKLDLDKGKRFKLNVNYPVQFWANESYGTFTKEEFQDFLRNLSPEAKKNLQIVIKKNPDFETMMQVTNQGKDLSKLEDAKRGNATNEYIKKGAPRFIVSIMNGDQEVARLQGLHDTVLIDPKTGKRIAAKNMTEAQMEDIFNLTYVGPKYKIKTKAEALQKIKDTYTEGQIIDQIFNEVLADQDITSINLFDLDVLKEQIKDPKLLERLGMLSLSMSPGNIAFKLQDSDGKDTDTNAKTKFNDIRYNQFKFEENENGELVPVGLDNENEEEGFFYIIDQTWMVFEEQDGSISRVRVQKPPIHNIDTNTEEGVTQLAAIEKLINSRIDNNNGFDYSEELGRYVLASILPNGQVTFVELQATQMEKENISEFITKLKNQQSEVNKKNLDENNEPKSENFNKDFNEGIANTLYISGVPGEQFSIKMGAYGNVIFSYVRNPGTKAQVGGSVALTVKDMEDVTDTASLIKKIKDKFTEKQNKLVADGKQEVALSFDISEKSFRKSIPMTATMEEMADTTATIRPEVRSNIGLTLTVTDSDHFQVHKDTEIDGTDTIENKQKQQEEVDPNDVDTRVIDNNFIKEYDPSLGGKGWYQVPSSILQKLVNKLGDEKGVAELTQLEKVVIDETDLIRRVEAGEFKKEIKQISFKEKQEQIKAKKLEIKRYTKEKLQLIKQELDELVSKGRMSRAERNLTYLDRKMKFMENDPGLLDLEIELDSLQNTRAYKITDNFDGRDVEDINVFIEWAKNNLPEFIGIEDINTLQKRLKNRGITVGMFMMELKKVSGGLKFFGNIYTSPNSGYRYHEAFHGVFRMLLTDQQISQYLTIAKKEVRKKLRKEGKNLKDELAAMRLLSPTYANLSQELLEERYYEEYLADRFQDFKQNPGTKKVSKGLKGIFNKIVEWIKSIFERFSPNTAGLNKLFKDIDSGKYKNIDTQNNRFTNAVSIGVTEPVFKIKVGTTTVYKNVDVNGKLEAGEVEQNIYLSASETNKLKNGIGALYLRRLRDIKGEYIPSILLNEAIKDYIEMYNPARPFYINEENGISYDEIEDELFEKYETLNKESVKREIAEEINNWLALFDLKMDLENEALDYQMVLEDQDAGDMVMSVGDWDMQTNQMGGFRNLPQALRAFIGMTTLEETDQFGNKYVPKIEYDANNNIIKEGPSDKHVVSVDYTTAYNGLLKAVSDATTPMEILQKLVLFSQTSVHSKAVIERFFREMGIKDYNSLLDKSALLPIDQIESANPAQFNQIVKSLQQFVVDYMFIEKNTKKGKTLGHVDVYAANHKDDAHDQINKWNSAYDEIYWKRKNAKSVRNAAVSAVNLLYNQLNTNVKSIDDNTLLEQSKMLSQNIFNTTGIKLSRGYVRFSILKKIKENAGNALLSPRQEKILASYKDIENITAEDASYWSGLLGAGRDLFANFSTKISENASEDKDTGESKASSGIQSRLKKFARGNAIFDETVGTTVFRDPEGNLIYAHQLPTFHLESIKELNGGTNTIDKLKNGYNENNNLLAEGSSFGILSENGEIKPLRISGQKQVIVNVDKDSGDITVTESDGTPGVTYGDSTPSDMLASIINTTLWNFNPTNGKVKTVTNKYGKEVAIVPSLIRVIEASNTGDFVALGSVHSVEYIDQKNKEFKLTNDYIKRHINNIKTEYDRIYLETQDLQNTNRDKIKGYNDINSLDELTLLEDNPTAARGFKLTNTGDLVTKVIVDTKEVGKRTKYTLDDTIKLELEDMAREGVPFEQAMQELPVNLKDLITDKLNFEFDQFMETAAELGVLDKISSAFGSSLLTRGGVTNQNIKDSMAAYNFKQNDLKYNIAQIFHSDFINTVDINNLLLGDQAISLKDSIDKIKRAKAQNAAGPNAQSVVGWKDKGIEATSEIKVVTHTDPKHDSPSGEQDTMDAQIYMTAKGIKHTQFGMGRLTKAQLEVIEKAEKGEKVSWYDWFGDPDKGSQGLKKGKGALNSQKYVYADGVTYLKMSIVPLIREEVSYRKGERWVARPGKGQLHNLLNKMEIEEDKGGIMMSVPETASKMMKKNVVSHDEVFNSEQDFDTNGPLQTIQARFLRLQQVNPFGKTEITDVRQMKELILSEQVDSTPVVIRGKETTVGKLKAAYQKAAGDRFELGFTSKRNLLFKLKDKSNDDPIYGFLFANQALQNRENIDVDLFSVLHYSINALKASKSKQQMLEFFETDETGAQKFNLNNPITRQQFEEKFFSFWNDTFAEKQPGTSYTLKSSYGHKVIKKVIALDPVTKQPIRWEVLRSDDYVSMDLRGQAPIIAKENYDNETDRTFVGIEVGDYYLDDLRHDVMEYDENNKPTGQRYSEFIAPPQFSSAIRFLKEGQTIPDAISKQFGTRVPSQDKHSSINLKLVDFSPVILGNSAIFTRELIEISGADFDIDQLYTQFKDFFVEKEIVKSSEEIEQEWEEWVGTPQWSPKAETNIVRVDRFGDKFDVAKSKKEFAAAKRRGDLTYTPKKNGAGDLVVQESAITKEEYGYNRQYRYDENTGEFSDIVEGKVVEYGAADLKIEQEHDQYLRWVIGQAKKPGSLIHMALNKWNNQNGIFKSIAPKDITVHASSQMKFIKNFIEDNAMIYGALKSISLPTDLKSYKSWKEIHNKGDVKGTFVPNTAALNNQLLDYKFGLLGNKSISEALPGREQAIKNEPANLAPLTDSVSKEGILEVIQELVPELKQMIDQGQINVDNLLGKVKTFESNKEGANSIGAAVLPNVVVNVLQTFDIDLINNDKVDHRLKFDNVVYDSFGNPYIKNENGKPDIQKRKQYIISAIITAMTDNAKEQLAAKLGLNKDALAIVVNMTALGVPIKTSILLIKNPSIQEAYKLAKNKKKQTDPGVQFYIEKRIKELEELNKKLKGESKVSKDVTSSSLLKSLRKFMKSGYIDPFNTKYTKELTKKEVKEEIKILNEFLKARNIKNFTGKAQSLITLLAGTGRSISALDSKMDDFAKLGFFTGPTLNVPFDMTSIINNKNNMLGRYFKGYMEFAQLLPNIFITRTKPFESILEGVYQNLSKDFTQMTDSKREKVINDILSMLTLKAYEHQLSLNSPIKPSLSNSMLYEKTEGVGISDVVEKIKARLDGKENTFINFYVYTSNKQPGVDLLEANTWATLSDQQLQDIQLSFLELFKDENTRDLAYDVIHYSMIKDGLQNRMGSFLKALPSDMLDGPINAIARVDDFFKGKVESTYEDVFGISQEQLAIELDKYFEHISNGTILKKVRSSSKNGKAILKAGKLKTAPIQKNKSGILGISMLNGIKSFDNAGDRKTINVELGPLSKEQETMQLANALYAKKLGWEVKTKIYETDSGAEIEYQSVRFPRIIVRTELVNGKKVEVLYKLDRIYAPGVENSNTLPNILQSNEGIGAMYKVMKEGLRGTKDQYGGGVMVAGNVPFTSTIDPKQNKTGKGKMSQTERESFTIPGEKAFNPTHPKIKERIVTNKGVKIKTTDGKEYGINNIPSNLKVSGPPQEAIEAGKKRAAAEKSADNIVKVKKDDVSSWTLRVDPKTGAVTNVNTGKKLNPRTDSKLINKAHINSGYTRYTEVSVKGKKYLVTNDGKVINAIPGSKNQGVAVKKKSALYAEAVKLAAQKKAKEDMEAPSLEEAVEILQRQGEDLTITKEDMKEELEKTEEVPVEETEEAPAEEAVEETIEEEIVDDPIGSIGYEFTPQEKKFVDWWDSLTEEQRVNVSEKAMGRFGAISVVNALQLLDARKIEVNDKLIENLKCYI